MPLTCRIPSVPTTLAAGLRLTICRWAKRYDVPSVQPRLRLRSMYSMANWDRTSKTETECVIYVQNSNLREYIKYEFICIEQLGCFLLYICAGTCIIVYLYCNLHSAKNSMADDPIPSLEYLKIPEKELYKWGIQLADDHEAVVFTLDIHPIVSMPTDFNVLEILANCFPDTVNIYHHKWLSITA